MAARSSVTLKAFYAGLQSLHFRPLKQIQFQFDPFHPESNSLRFFIHHCSSRKLQATNYNCVIKTSLVSDRSEPVINLELENGKKVIFKTAYFTSLEILEEISKLVTRFDTAPLTTDQTH